jgi:adenosylcobinamide-phosphate synthase
MKEMHTYMFPQSFYLMALILFLAIIIDLIFGEPPWKPPYVLHPTVWINKLTRALLPFFKNKNPTIEKINGVILALTVILIIVLPLYLCLKLINSTIGILFYLPIAAIILKTSFTIRLETEFAKATVKYLEENNIPKARKLASMFSRRDAENLTGSQIVSAVVESISENLADFKLSPFFYYALFGVPGAVAFRVINTLDGTVGFKDPEHLNIGWFSAWLDTVANFILSRLSAFLIILASWMLKENYRNAWKIAVRDRKKISSINHGWPIAAAAGALQVRLEKPSSYAVGDEVEELSSTHIFRALRIRNMVLVLFSLLVVLPTIFSLSLLLPPPLI